MQKIVLFFLLLFLSFNLSLKNTEAKNLPIIINQIMIGQEIGAKNEFIELYNPNNFNIDLKGYSLKKKSQSGSESNIISNKNFNGIILKNSYFLISSPEFCDQINCDIIYSTSGSLSKNNTIILYNTEKEIEDKLGYGEAIDFFEKPAPGPLNNQFLKRKKINISDLNNFNDFFIEENITEIRNSQENIIKISNYQEKITTIPANKKNILTKETKTPKLYNLKEIKNLKNGDLIITSGIISVLPTTFGTQYFYIHDKYETDENIYGLQIYNYNKKFPQLKEGDYIKITGELSITENDTVLNYKLKTKEINDIEIISHNNKIPDPQIEKINNFKSSQVGNLKKIRGEITQNKSKQIYLDDGEGEILIDIKKGTQINTKILKEGEKFEILGILNYLTNKEKILPINSDSIKSLNNKTEEEGLGKILDNDFWEIKKENNNKKILKYIIIILIGIASYLIFIIKRRP